MNKFTIVVTIILIAIAGGGYFVYHQIQSNISTGSSIQTTSVTPDERELIAIIAKKIPNVDLRTLSPVFTKEGYPTGWTGLVKDKNNVYWETDGGYESIPNADSSTFELVYNNLGNIRESPATTFYAKDQNHVWIFYPAETGNNVFEVVQEANPATFVGFYESGKYVYDAQDKNNKYLLGKIVD